MFSAPQKKKHVFPQQVWSIVKPNFLAQAQLPQGAVLVSCAAGARRVARGAWRVRGVNEAGRRATGKSGSGPQPTQRLEGVRVSADGRGGAKKGLKSKYIRSTSQVCPARGHAEM